MASKTKAKPNETAPALAAQVKSMSSTTQNCGIGMATEGQSDAVGIAPGLDMLRAALDNLGTNVLMADADRKLVYANTKAVTTLQTIAGEVREAFNVDVNDILGLSIHTFHANPGKIEKILSNPANFPRKADLSFRNIAIEAEINVVLDAGGNVVGHVVSWEDVTDRERAEEELRTSEARARAVFESRMIGHLFWEADGSITDANDAFLEMMGYTRDDVLSRPLNWRDMTPPEYREQDDRALQEVLDTGVLAPIEKEYIRKDGTRIPILLGAATFPQPYEGGVAFVIDVTARKRAEKALLESNRRLTRAKQVTGLGIIDWNLKTEEIYWSRETYRLFGVNPEKTKLSFDLALELVHPDDRELVKMGLESARHGKSHYDIDHRIVRPNGEEIWVQAQGEVSRDADGEPAKLLGTMIDITERKRTERSLARFRSALDCSADGVFLIDRASMRFVDVNDTACKSVGYLREELMAMGPQDIKTLLTREHLEHQLDEILASGNEFGVIDTLHRRKDGSSFPVEVYIKTVAGEASPVLVAMARDISERKLAESALRESNARFESLFEDVPVSLWEEDFSDVLAYLERLHFREIEDFGTYLGQHPEITRECVNRVRIMAVNRATLDLYEATTQTELRLGFTNTFTERSYNAFKNELIAIWRGRMQFETETERRSLRGRVRQVAIRWSVPVGYRETLSRVLVSVTDLTKHKRAEEEVHERERELTHMSRLTLIGEIASGLAHEVNQPLAAIVNYNRNCIKRIRSGTPEPEKLVAALEKSIAQAERGAQIIARTRDFVRKRKPHRSSTGINEVIHETLELLEIEIRHSGVRVHLDLANDLSLILVDRVEIQQVLVNLVRNGLNSTEDSKPIDPRLTITTTESSDDRVEVAVSDCGSGLPPVDVERLFEPFFTTRTDGLGMGLAICRTVIDAHGGKLWATPNEDRGVTFRFSIPIGGAIHGHEDR